MGQTLGRAWTVLEIDTELGYGEHESKRKKESGLIATSGGASLWLCKESVVYFEDHLLNITEVALHKVSPCFHSCTLLYLKYALSWVPRWLSR